MILLVLAALALPQDPGATPAALDGRWRGAVMREGAMLPLEVEFGDAGQPALIDVPTWGLYSMPVAATYEPPELLLPFGGSRIRLHVEPAAGAMRGHFLTGSEVPDENAMTVELTRILAPALPAVTTYEVRFTSADGVELAGTLALPAGEGPHPGIVLVQGRTYGSRDQFRSHAILAARRGIAGLAFDGRGTGGSGGVRGEHTLAHRLDDAEAALKLLRARPEVDAERVGMFGHSAGGWVIPIVALRSPPVAFLVLHSGPAEPLGDQQGHVFQELVRRSGIEPTEDELEAILAFYRTLATLAADSAPWSEIEPVVSAARATRWGPHVSLPEGLDNVNLAYYGRNPHDSTDALRATKTPVLALFGSEDFVVQTEFNVPLLEARLREAGNEEHRIVTFEGADHDLMIPASEDGAYRWQRRPPGYFELLFDWVGERTLQR
jgi:hypothetical protein